MHTLDTKAAIKVMRVFGQSLWVGGQEGLPDLRHVPNVTLPSFARTPLRKCAIVVDRHVHKNGGSTVRDLFLEHERTGHALYQGYTRARPSPIRRPPRSSAALLPS